LAGSFINADFDKAFQMIRDGNMSKLTETGKPINEDAGEIRTLNLAIEPDLSEYLY
jgi:hypothetical protein